MKIRRGLAPLTLALALAAGSLVAAAGPASAATVTSTVTIGATSGSAPPGYSYPNANIVVSGDVNPGNANNLRTVHLWRKLASQSTYYEVTAQTSDASGGYSFSTKLPRDEPWAIYTVRVEAMTAKNGDKWSYVSSSGVQVVQTAGPEALTMSMLSPKIMETAGRTGPESTSSAAQLGRVQWVTGGAARTLNLQERNASVYGDSYWHDVEAKSVPAGSSGTWFPSTALWGSSEYRAIYHYETGVDTSSPVLVPTQQAPIFYDDFSGQSLDLSKWEQRSPNHGQGYETHSLSTVTLDGQVATLRPRVADTDNCSHVLADGVSAHGQTCVWTPHIVTTAPYAIAPPADGESVWMAARIKAQSGANGSGGPHSSFWTNARYCDDGYASEGHTGAIMGGEVDIMEYMGDGRTATPDGIGGSIGHNQYYSTSSSLNGEGKWVCGAASRDYEDTPSSQIPSGAAGEKWSEKYHIYAVRWIQPTAAGAPSTYALFVDGIAVGDVEGPHSGAIPGMILSNLVNDYENYGVGSVGGAVGMDVDWVQAWRL